MSTERAHRIGTQLREAAIRDPLLGTNDINVTIGDGVLAIRGTVRNAAGRERVAEIARAMAPDLQVDNGLVVSSDTGPKLASDEALAEKANRMMAQRFLVGGETGRSVIISQGRAFLRGTFGSLGELRDARDAVAAIDGIVGVDTSSVTLTGEMTVPELGASAIDEIDVVNRLEENLAKAGFRLGDWVDARLAMGKLELVGLVGSEAQRHTVIDVASRQLGVRQIIDHLTVLEGGGERDRETEQRIRHAFGAPNDPVSPADIKVFVVGERAYLFGETDTPEGKDKAIDLARQAGGIKHVTDNIRIVTRRARPVRGPGGGTGDLAASK